MSISSFDIFQGPNIEDANWVEALEGLADATKRMKQFAAECPGQYFVFDVSSRKILASIDTRQAGPT